jgi:hypothetical protein
MFGLTLGADRDPSMDVDGGLIRIKPRALAGI